MRKLVLTAACRQRSLRPLPPLPSRSRRGPFTGFRVGAVAGWDGLRPGSGQNSSITDGHGADGFLYGGELGYDRQIGHVVIGAEGEVDRLDRARSPTIRSIAPRSAMAA